MGQRGMTIGGFSQEAVNDIKAVTNDVYEVTSSAISKASVIMETMNGKAKNNNTEAATNSVKVFADNMTGLLQMYKNVISASMDEVINLGNKMNDEGMTRGGKTIKGMLDDFIIRTCPESGIVPAGEEVQITQLDQLTQDLLEVVRSTIQGFGDITPKIRDLARGGSTGNQKIYSGSFAKFQKAIIPILDELQKVARDYGSMQNEAFNNLKSWKSRTDDSAAEVAGSTASGINEQIDSARKYSKGAVESML